MRTPVGLPRLRLRLVLAVTLLGFITVGARASTKQFQPNDPRFTVRDRNDRVVIHADGPPIQPRLVKTVAAEVRDGMDFALDRLGWKRQTNMRAPLHVYMTTTASLKEFGLTVGGGVSWGPREFVMSRLEARESPSYRLNTETHEAFHSLHFRLDPSHRGPTILWEGLASLIADHAAAQKLRHVGFLSDEANAMASWTPKQARRVFENFRGRDPFAAFSQPHDDLGTWGAELMGALFLEYVRVHFGRPGEAGFRQLGRLALETGKGKPFAEVVKEIYGYGYAELQDRFIRHLRSTAAQPELRLRGTVWQGYAAKRR